MVHVTRPPGEILSLLSKNICGSLGSSDCKEMQMFIPFVQAQTLYAATTTNVGQQLPYTRSDVLYQLVRMFICTTDVMTVIKPYIANTT